MLTSHRRRLAAVATVLALPTLGACGFNYQTDKVYQPSIGVNNRDGTVDVLGAVVVSSTDGRGTFVASLVNKDLKQGHALVSVSGESLQAEVLTPVQVAPQSLVNLADAGAVSVQGEGVTPGKFVRLTLQFDSGQTAKVNAPVVTDTAEYDGVKPAVPSSSPSASTTN